MYYIFFSFYRTLVYAAKDKVEVLDKTERNLEGELLVRSPSVFQEYFDNPAETKKTFYKGYF